MEPNEGAGYPVRASLPRSLQSTTGGWKGVSRICSTRLRRLSRLCWLRSEGDEIFNCISRACGSLQEEHDCWISGSQTYQRVNATRETYAICSVVSAPTADVQHMIMERSQKR